LPGPERKDLQGKRTQFVTVENSMGVVHRSTGREKPASRKLRSESAIVAGIAEATLGSDPKMPWNDWISDYDRIRDEIEAIIPGFTDFNRRVRHPGGFDLPNPAKQRAFSTPSGKAVFFVHPMTDITPAPGQLILQTMRSHDQFNTTVYGMNDRYRGISNQRRIVFLNPDDMKERGVLPLPSGHSDQPLERHRAQTREFPRHPLRSAQRHGRRLFPRSQRPGPY